MNATSLFQEQGVLSQATLGVVAIFAIQREFVTHKVYLSLLPNPDPGADYEIDAEIEFFLDGVLTGRLPAKVTNAPRGIYSNLFPVGASTDMAEDTVSVAFPGAVTSYVLFPRTLIASATQAKLTVKSATNLTTGAQLAAVQFYFAVDSATLPF